MALPDENFYSHCALLRLFQRAVEIKSFEETGVFEGYGSVFGNADWYGDVVMPGAFANSLARACGHEAWAIKQGT